MENGIKNPIRLITEKQLAGLFTETMRYCDVIPQGRSCELIGIVKNRCGIQTFFSTPPLCRISVLRNIIVKSGIKDKYTRITPRRKMLQISC